MTNAAALFDQGLDVFESVVARVGPDGWERPSPCAGWRAIDVLGHLGTSVAMGVSVLQGRQPTWPTADRPGDLVTGDPLAYWQDLASQARAALDGADLEMEMDTPMGRRTVADRLAFPAIDLFVHAWDIGQAVGITVEIPTEVIEFAHHHIDPLPTDAVRGPGGAFGAEAEAPADATPTEAFAAWTGRTPLPPR